VEEKKKEEKKNKNKKKKMRRSPMVIKGTGILGKLTFLACFLDTNMHTAISRDNKVVPNNTDLLK
jgi:hypothetical protein